MVSGKKRYYMVNDLVKLNSSQKVNAQGKAREDVVTTLRGLGYRICNIVNRKYSLGKSKRYHHYPFISNFFAKKQSKKFLKGVRPGDVVFIQDFHLSYMQYIAKECLVRKAKVVFLVHDIQSIRYHIETNEVNQLNNCSVVLVHTLSMKEKLQKLGVVRPMKIINLFDYYSADTMHDMEDVVKHRNEVVFAGNLAKSEFLRKLEAVSSQDVMFNLYGILGDLDISAAVNMSYKGVFKPANTGVIQGGWGLVWDGDSIDTCEGVYGDYLRYNSSHKISLYLACGLPIIVWEKSSVANLVREQQLGIVVPNLHSVCDHLNQISDDAYASLVSNARRVGEKLRSGDYLKAEVAGL